MYCPQLYVKGVRIALPSRSCACCRMWYPVVSWQTHQVRCPQKAMKISIMHSDVVDAPHDKRCMLVSSGRNLPDELFPLQFCDDLASAHG